MTVAFARGTSTNRALFILAAIVFLLSSLVAAPVTAQSSDGSFTFDGGQTLTWGDDWELDEDSVELVDGVESALFVRGTAVLSVLSVPNDFDLIEARDIFLDAFLEAVGDSVTIDQGSYGQVSYSLDLVDSEGSENGVFTLFRAGTGNTPTFAYVFFASVSDFSDEFASVQSVFQLDGEELFDGVEGQGLQELLRSNADSTAGAPDADQADPPTVDVRAEYTWIDTRDLVIRPNDYFGDKIAVQGSVLSIHVDADGFTALQIWLDGGSDVAIVGFEGESFGIYEGTWVTVYGEGAGTFDIQNAFGGTVTQPLIFADIVDW